MRADFDFDGDRGGSRGDSVIRVLVVAAEAALVAGAVFILYLAFRGPSGHPSPRALPTTTTTSPGSLSAAAVPGAGQRAAARPKAVPPASSPSLSSGSRAADTTRAAAGPLARAQSYLAGRRGKTEVAVYDLASGRQWTLGPQAPQAEGSVATLEILEAVLHRRTVQRTVLSLTEQKLAPPMIELSDDGAATTLWGDAGGAKGMRAFDHAARLTGTSPADCLRCAGSAQPGWGLTTTTPQDQIAALRQLARPSGVLDKNDQKYALFLLRNVALAQRWGVSAGVPAGVTVALKNGLAPLDAGKSGWQANSVGWISGDGRSYLMAVLSTGDPGEQYGITTLNHLGALVWNALAPPRG